MANPIHLEKLCQGPKVWNAWRDENRDVVPDLTEASLTLSQRQFGPSAGGPINLRQANLEGAVLRYATLTGADLEGAVLAGADLVHARLDGANLAGSDLTDAVCEHADFGGANLDRALLTGASFANVRNLTEEQIALAHGDATTLLPIAIMPPSNWFPELDDGIFPDYPVPDRFRDDDAYTVLGVERDASAADIRAAFRNLVKKFHPDLNPGNEDAQESFKQVSTAYRILSDPEKRSRYDKGEIGSDGEINPEYEARRQFRRYAYRFYAAAALSLVLAAGVLGVVWHAVLTEDSGRGRVELTVAKAPKSSERLGLDSPGLGTLQVDAARRAKLGMMETGDQDEESQGETLSQLARVEGSGMSQAEPIVPGATILPAPSEVAGAEGSHASGATDAGPPPTETAKTETSASPPVAGSTAEAGSGEAAASSQPPAEMVQKTEAPAASQPPAATDRTAEAAAPSQLQAATEQKAEAASSSQPSAETTQKAEVAVPNPPAEPPAPQQAVPQTQIAAADPQPAPGEKAEASTPEASSEAAAPQETPQEPRPAAAAEPPAAPEASETAAAAEATAPPGQAAPQPPAVSDKPAIAAVPQEQRNSARPLGEDHKGQEARPAQADAARASAPAKKPEGFLSERAVASAGQPQGFFGTQSLRKRAGWKGPRDDISSLFRHRAVRQTVAHDPSQATASMEPPATRESVGGQEEVWDVYTHSLPAAEEGPAPGNAWKALAPDKAVARNEVPAPRPDDIAPPARPFHKPPAAANRKQAVSDILAGGL